MACLHSPSHARLARLPRSKRGQPKSVSRNAQVNPGSSSKKLVSLPPTLLLPRSGCFQSGSLDRTSRSLPEPEATTAAARPLTIGAVEYYEYEVILMRCLAVAGRILDGAMPITHSPTPARPARPPLHYRLQNISRMSCFECKCCRDSLFCE